MGKPRFALVLFLLLSFGVSLSVAAEDIPETAYDESEPLPYEDTPLFSMVALQASASMTQADYCNALCFDPSRKRSKLRCENSALPACGAASLFVLNHSLRC
jgi:hypothetical protein